ncbi:site-specific integrase [Methylobacterium sp. WL18]|uniref:site-specific integrase n=1 Tax=Methylobacterium sp. WL18 TaxID=2603897 RepID=UPI0011CC6EC2|nr:site-specific integrase [Methylobacterium sp. WL18]TXN76612.1 site-specific integrase [Methylobacterium sp. WL18]
MGEISEAGDFGTRAAKNAAIAEDVVAEVARRSREARGPVLAVTPAGVVATPDGLAALAERAKGYAEGARAQSTRTAYRGDWRRYEGWCAGHGLAALPAEPMTVGLYLADAAETYAPATLTRWLSAISVAHTLAGHHLDTRHPAIRDVLRGVRRARGTAQRQAAPITTPVLRRLLDTCAAGRVIDLRDHALLLVGYAAALRQSELVALDATDISVSDQGLRLVIRRSKADQEGAGQIVEIGRTGSPTCPVAAYEMWISASEISAGAVFRRVDRHGAIGARLVPEGVAHVVRSRAGRAGLDPMIYSGHSLRAGFATTAAIQNIEERVIAGQTRHRSTATLRRYIREGEIWRRNLSAAVGL